MSSSVCPLGMWYFTAGRWTLGKYRLVLGSQPMTTASPLPRTVQRRVSQCQMVKKMIESYENSMK